MDDLRYPLLSLVRLRDQRLELHAKQFNDSLVKRTASKQHLRKTQRRQIEHGLLVDSKQRQEASRVAAGKSRCIDWIWMNQWYRRQQIYGQRLNQRVEDAERTHRKAQHEVHLSQDGLRAAHGDVRLIERHREHYEKRVRMEQEKTWEGEIEEDFSARWNHRRGQR